MVGRGQGGHAFLGECRAATGGRQQHGKSARPECTLLLSLGRSSQPSRARTQTDPRRGHKRGHKGHQQTRAASPARPAPWPRSRSNPWPRVLELSNHSQQRPHRRPPQARTRARHATRSHHFCSRRDLPLLPTLLSLTAIPLIHGRVCTPRRDQTVGASLQGAERTQCHHPGYQRHPRNA